MREGYRQALLNTHYALIVCALSADCTALAESRPAGPYLMAPCALTLEPRNRTYTLEYAVTR